MEYILSLKPSDRLKNRNPFFGSDERYNEILFRHVCRNYPEVLSLGEKEEWIKFCKRRILGTNDTNPPKEPLYLHNYYKIIENLENKDENQNPRSLTILSELKAYGRLVEDQL